MGSGINGDGGHTYSGIYVSLSNTSLSIDLILAVGAHFNNSANGVGSGHVRVYAWNMVDWKTLGEDIDGKKSGDQSGYSVSLSTDGYSMCRLVHYRSLLHWRCY